MLRDDLKAVYRNISTPIELIGGMRPVFPYFAVSCPACRSLVMVRAMPSKRRAGGTVTRLVDPPSAEGRMWLACYPLFTVWGQSFVPSKRKRHVRHRCPGRAGVAS